MTRFSIALVLLTLLLIITCTTIPIITNAKHSKNSGSDSSGSNDSGDSKQTPTQTPTEQQQTPEIVQPTESDNTQPLVGDTGNSDSGGSSGSHSSDGGTTIHRKIAAAEQNKEFANNQIDLTHFGVKSLNSTHFLISFGNDTDSFRYVVAKKQ